MILGLKYEEIFLYENIFVSKIFKQSLVLSLSQLLHLNLITTFINRLIQFTDKHKD